MRSSGLLAVLLFGFFAPLAAQQPEWTDLSARRQTDGIRAVEAKITYVAGELEVRAADAGLLYDIGLHYDAALLRPERSWRAEGDVGRLELRFESVDDNGTDWDMDDGEFGELVLGLSREVPTDLTLEVGAAESSLDLGGIPLTGLVYRTGASSTEMKFGEPNPARIGTLELAAGAASFEAAGLGNARFDELEFDGAVGDVTLDFTGEWSGDATADIAVGLGALRLVIPRDIGVRLEKSGFLAGFNPRGMEKVEGGWQTSNFDSARHTLRIKLKAAFGKVDVQFVN
ncbi:MAG: LiaF-related protein [marine benthic group bacterium]|nr:LiaF-related protein [Candidatus Carthagonibacter metallireducens]MCL7964322.1 LiaF-related protein [Gemmatimonadota bacterium]MCL7976123.1 LiaF-related protein [Gemmatimonadota bacterium]MCL7980589.1 LiaF-related protein [Gemmatimonadota bacterium]MCL7984157.1 LiaF-related protein [Gemmatimonadota bacterium]